MKKPLLILASAFVINVNAQTYLLNENFNEITTSSIYTTASGTYTVGPLPTGWTTSSGFKTYAKHGMFNTNACSSEMDNTHFKDTLYLPTITGVTASTQMSFQYRFVNAVGYPSTGATLGTGDQVTIDFYALGSWNTLATFNNNTNPTPLTSFTTYTYACTLCGSIGNVQLRVDVTRATANADWFIDIDHIIVGNNIADTSINVNSPTICAGNAATLTAYNASTYSWSTGATTASIIVTPTVTTTYTFTGTMGTTTSTATSTVTINGLPLPAVTVNSATICTGATTTLTADGASTYTWNTSATSTSITPSPTVTTHYTVTGTGANNCTNIATSTITVNALPTLTITANSTTVCAGSTNTLTASGANTYTWSTNSTYDTTLVSPIINTTYTVTGTDINGCINMTTITQTVTNCSTTDIQQYANSNEVNIYPNPNNGSFVIEASPSLTLPQGKGTLMQVYDVNGKLVLSQTINGRTTIDANVLNEGVYNISLQSNEGVVNKRLVIVC